MLDKQEFLQKYRVEKRFEASGLVWEELEAIYDDYTSRQRQETLKGISAELNRLFSEEEIPGRHSVGYRIKNPEHLIEKIIRNATDGHNVEKYKRVDRKNYYKLITDLIGVRILVLTKEDWEGIHDFIMENFEDSGEHYINFRKEDYGYLDESEARWLVEPPVAYVRYGDSDIFKGMLETKYTHKDYRSQHYTVKFRNVYCEIQVRTLAEEVYGEFDHQVRYPYNKDNKFLKQYTSMLSKITVATDHILSLCMKLPEDILLKCDECYEEEIFPQFSVVPAKNKGQETRNWGTQNVLEACNINLERRMKE